MSRFAKTKRAIQSVYASVLVGLAECLPLGILQVCIVLSFVDAACDAQANIQCKYACLSADAGLTVP